MKKQRQKILTDYDDDGELDRKHYETLQKKIFQREIDFKIRTDAVTYRQFAIKPLDIEFMQSTAIKEQPKFKEIKKIMTDYNNHAMQMGQIVEGSHLQTKVMNSLQKFMRLMMLAPDTQTKITILDISYHWMKQHLDPKSKRVSHEQVLQDIKDVLIKKALVPIDIINKSLIYTQLNQELKLYKLKARTSYNEIDAPKYQLANYHTHKLEFISDKSQRKPQAPKNWIENVKFPKVQLPGYYIQEEPEPIDNEGIEIEKEVQKKQLIGQNKPQNAGQNFQNRPTQGNLQLKQGQLTVVPQQPQQDLDFGVPNNDEPAEPEQVEDLEEKKKGRLDPLVKVFLLQRIKAKERGEFSCDNRYLRKRNKVNQSFEQDLNQLKYMSCWGREKSRLKTTINRKNESLRILNKVSNEIQQHSERSYEGNIESDMNRLKVKKNLYKHMRNLSSVQIPPEKLNHEISNSVFDRRRIKTDYAHKPFSAILSENDYTNQRNLGLEQIGDLKQKFSKAKIYTPMDSIVKGLVHPVIQADPSDLSPNSQKLVWPNTQMLSNPFFKVAKKKKKKKKKK